MWGGGKIQPLIQIALLGARLYFRSMSEKFPSGAPAQEHNEKKEKSVEIWGKLAEAFGGYSQVPDRVVGMAIIGQVNNNGLKFGQKELDGLVDQICERWEDQEPNSDEIRKDIVQGMKEGAKDWPREGNEHVWSVIDALEGKK